MSFVLAYLIGIIGAVMCVLLIWLGAKFKRTINSDIDENKRKKKASQEGMAEIVRCFYSKDENVK